MRPDGLAPPLAAAAALCALFVASAVPGAYGKVREPGPSGPVSAAELVQTRGLSGLSLSPDGRQAVVRVEADDIAQNRTLLGWRLVDLTSGETLSLGDAGEPTWNVNGGLQGDLAQWSADGRWIYFRRVKDQQAQLVRVRISDRRTEQLTHEAADVEAFFLAPDNTLNYIVSGATRAEIIAAEAAEYDAGILWDRKVIPGFPVTHNFPHNGRMATHRYVTGIAHDTLLDARPPVFKALAPNGRDARLIAPEARKRLAEWKQTPSSWREVFDPSHTDEILSSSRRSRARLDLPPVRADAVRSPSPQLKAQVAGAAERQCEDKTCQDAIYLDIVGWMNDGALVFQSYAFGETSLRIWDVSANTVSTVASGSRYLGDTASGTRGACQLTGAKAICIASAADLPPRLVSIDLRTGAEKLLLDPNPALTPARLGKAETIVVTNRVGMKAFARVILPRDLQTDGAGKRQHRPLVITSYTCSGLLQGGSGRDVPEHVLAGLGYVAACLELGGDNVPLPSGYNPNKENYELAQFELVEDTIRVLADRGIADPERVVFAGFSGSSTMIQYALTKTRALTAAIVMTQGSADPMYFYQRSFLSSERLAPTVAGPSPPFDTRDNPFFREFSPAWNADKIVTPLLMQLADAEYVPMLQLFRAMNDLGRAVELYIFPDEYHLKRIPRHRLAAYQRNIDWIEFWLRGEEAGGSQRVEQSARWRILREKQCKLFGDVSETDKPWYCRASVPPAAR